MFQVFSDICSTKVLCEGSLERCLAFARSWAKRHKEEPCIVDEKGEVVMT